MDVFGDVNNLWLSILKDVESEIQHHLLTIVSGRHMVMRSKFSFLYIGEKGTILLLLLYLRSLLGLWGWVRFVAYAF